MARLGAAAGRMPNPDYACRRFRRAVVDAGSIPAASTFWLNGAVCWPNRSDSFCIRSSTLGVRSATIWSASRGQTRCRLRDRADTSIGWVTAWSSPDPTGPLSRVEVAVMELSGSAPFLCKLAQSGFRGPPYRFASPPRRLATVKRQGRSGDEGRRVRGKAVICAAAAAPGGRPAVAGGLPAR